MKSLACWCPGCVEWRRITYTDAGPDDCCCGGCCPCWNAGLRRRLVHFLDWFDVHVLGHRWYWFCHRVAESSWWADLKR